jgi:hypothetical protein
MLKPSIVCAALLGLAQPVFSHPVASPTYATSSTDLSGVVKRAPQGPKLGGANFPGIATRKSVLYMQPSTDITSQTLQSSVPTAAGMPLPRGPQEGMYISRSQSLQTSTPGVWSRMQMARRKMPYPICQIGLMEAIRIL